MNIDLTGITLTGLISLTAIVAAVDIIGSILASVAVSHTFSLSYVAIWLESHGLKRVLPIFGLAWLGNGVPQLAVPAIPALWALAVAGLAAYVLETVASLQGSFTGAGSTPPADSSPVPPPV